MSWDEIIGRSKMDENFRQEVSMAKIYDGAARSWAPESFTDSSQCGYRVEQAATFYTDSQLQANHNISLKDVPGCTVTIQSETGQSLEGVVVETVPSIGLPPPPKKALWSTLQESDPSNKFFWQITRIKTIDPYRPAASRIQQHPRSWG